MDDTMIEGVEPLEQSVLERHFPVWFAKARVFIRLPQASLPSAGSPRDALGYDTFKPNTIGYCFVEFYDTILPCNVTVDIVNNILDCVRVKLNKEEGSNQLLLPQNLFALTLRTVIAIKRTLFEKMRE